MSTIVPSRTTRAFTSLVATPTVEVLPAARAANTVYQLFPAAQTGDFQERVIVNPNTAGSIWVSVLEGIDPAANGEGSFEVAPGGRWVGPVLNQIRVLFTVAAMKVTAFQR